MSGTKELEIYSTNGIILNYQSVDNGINKINISDLKCGICFVKLQGDSERMVKKSLFFKFVLEDILSA